MVTAEYKGYSVLMSVYYKEKPEYLKQAIDSIQTQTLPTDDFVLVCDGSLNDELDSVIMAKQQEMGTVLNVVRLAKNGGLGNALNEGIKHCKNELVARMDSDDIAYTDRCEKQIEVFNTHPEVSICSGIVEEFTTEPNVVDESTFAKQIAMIEAGMIEPKVMVGNLKSLRTYADVRDAVRAYYMLVTVNPIPGEYYNIGGSYTCEVGDTLNTLISYSTKKDEIQVVTDPERLRPIDADLQIPDCRKFKEHTGWEPQISFETTMHDLLDYWRARIQRGEIFLTR